MERSVGVEVFMINNEIDIEEAAELYAVFLNELIACTDELKQSMGKGDKEAMLSVIHNIKGIASSYMLYDTYEIVSDIYLQLKKDSIQDMDNRMQSLLAEVASERDKIIKYFKKSGIVLKEWE